MSADRRTPATVVAIATYIVVAGIFTQSGVILAPAARSLHATLPDTAGLFAYLYAGNLGAAIQVRSNGN